ncbi:ema, partial [Symbiodinium sp. KB8]
MIWGDKREERFFEYFCEKGFLARFDSIMRTCGSTAVQKQVLQTMMILMQNIRDQRSLMYMLSNNHINVLLGAPFDTRDEELLAYHVSLIKALSLRLNESTVFFFYN